MKTETATEGKSHARAGKTARFDDVIISNATGYDTAIKGKFWLFAHTDTNFVLGDGSNQNSEFRCGKCNTRMNLYTMGRVETIRDTHNITGTHYVCSAHNYVGTSQYH